MFALLHHNPNLNPHIHLNLIMRESLPKRIVQIPDLIRQVQTSPRKANAPLRLKLSAQVQGTPEETTQWQVALQEATTITAVDVRILQLPEENNEDPPLVAPSVMYQLVRDLGRLPNMKSLKLSGYCHAMPIPVLTHLLTKAQTLSTVHLTSVKFSILHPSDLQNFTTAIATHPSLTDWRLQDCQLVAPYDTNSLFLDAILEGIAQSNTMESLTLSPTRPNAMGVLSSSAIPAVTKLKSLRLGWIGNFWDPTPTSPLQVLLALLASNRPSTNLCFLHIPFHPDPIHCTALHKTLLHNTTLRGLSLRTYKDASPTSLTLVAEALEQNTTLEEFELLGSMKIRDTTVLQAFAKVLQTNYTLQELILFELVTSRHHCSDIYYYSKLNQHGRKRWLQDMYQNNTTSSTNKEEDGSMEFLEQLAQDTDDLYYYLSQMNPSYLIQQIR